MVRLVRRQIAEREEITHWHVNLLLSGCGFSFTERDWSHDELCSMWELVKPHVWERLIESIPGWRCWAWWKFDAPERRLRTDGGLHSFDDSVRQKNVERVAADPSTVQDYQELAYSLYFGRPRISHGFRVEYETDEEYLTRLLLWEPGEQEAAEKLSHQIRVAAKQTESEMKQRGQFNSTSRLVFLQEQMCHEHAALDKICSLFPSG